VRQARRGARTIQHLLHGNYGIDIPVVPALVIWGRGAPTLPNGVAIIDGVAVLSGKQDDVWRDALAAKHLDIAQVNAITESIEDYIERREAHARTH
jgi:hypothetical protein